VLARTANADDPRTVGELRAAGLLALSRGWTCLPTPQGAHPSDTAAQPSARRIVLHAYTDSGPDGATGSLTLTGYGSVTNHTAAQLAAGATIRSHDLAHLADADTDAARRYRPSDAVALFCRGRDGTCVFPGCTTPAEKADLDHIIPFDHADPDCAGPTPATPASTDRTPPRAPPPPVWSPNPPARSPTTPHPCTPRPADASRKPRRTAVPAGTGRPPRGTAPTSGTDGTPSIADYATAPGTAGPTPRRLCGRSAVRFRTRSHRSEPEIHCAQHIRGLSSTRGRRRIDATRPFLPRGVRKVCRHGHD